MDEHKENETQLTPEQKIRELATLSGIAPNAFIEALKGKGVAELDHAITQLIGEDYQPAQMVPVLRELYYAQFSPEKIKETVKQFAELKTGLGELNSTLEDSDNSSSTDVKSPSPEPKRDIFEAKAIAHYLHWAHVFLHRYYLENTPEKLDIAQWTKKKSQIAICKLYNNLREFSAKIGEIAYDEKNQALSDEEKLKILGQYISTVENRLTDTLATAHIFASFVQQRDDALEQGPDEPDKAKPEEKAMNKKNLERLDKGLMASLFCIGSASASVSPLRPNLSRQVPSHAHRYTLNSDYTSTIRKLFKVSGLDSPEITMELLPKAKAACLAGYYTYRKTHPPEIGAENIPGDDNKGGFGGAGAHRGGNRSGGGNRSF